MNRIDNERTDRKEWILVCAEDLFTEKGINSTTMEELATKAGVSKGALYLHFANKQEIILQIAVRGLFFLQKSFSNVLLKSITGKEMLSEFAEILKSYIRSHPCQVESFSFYERIELQPDFEPNRESQKIIEKLEQSARTLFIYLHRALQIGMQDGSIQTKTNSNILALIIWAELQGLLRMYNYKSIRGKTSIFEEFKPEQADIFEKFLELIF